jgi:8-oxo-dGTP pyrophosphatase MutT (NUDIX family)
VFHDAGEFWMLPGGGREEESEEECVRREVHEEAGLVVAVDRLLLDMPANPPDGTYVRWRTFLCSVVSGEAAPGGGEGSNASLVAIMWLPLARESEWPPDVCSDRFLHPQIRAIRRAIDDRPAAAGVPPSNEEL